MIDATQHDTDFIDLAADIVGAYVTKDNVPASELPGLITATHAALMKLTTPGASMVKKLTPPVPIRKTVTSDAIISLENGKPHKSLKRHLTTRGLSPDLYCQKWGLPHDYPTVAMNHAGQRSELAKTLGLGQIWRDRVAARNAKAASEAVAPAHRGSPKKTDTAAAE